MRQRLESIFAVFFFSGFSHFIILYICLLCLSSRRLISVLFPYVSLDFFFFQTVVTLNIHFLLLLAAVAPG